MTVCPLDYRYGDPRLREIFSEEGKLARMLLVEAALAESEEALGLIPKGTAARIAAAAGKVDAARVREIEAEIGHDVMSVVRALSENAGPAGEYVHFGATSNDIIDSATALQLRDALAIVDAELARLRSALAALARRHRDAPMLGRTHGQWAVPMTFGLKMAVFAAEVDRHAERLAEVRRRAVAGKLLGAVGTGAALGPRALDVQADVMRRLGIAAETAPSQLVGRDRYAELLCWCAGLCASLEKFATEVRNLQRPEIGEVAEAFDVERQVGSSTMAQKKNPVVSENVCGLSRVVRGFVVPGLECVVLWHERDLSNSSAERFTLSHAVGLTHDAVAKSAWLFETLEVRPKRMLENLKLAGGEVMAESVMMSLARKGVGRQKAHSLVRRASMEARAKGVDFGAHLRGTEIEKTLGRDGLARALDPASYLGSSGEIVDAVVGKSGGEGRRASGAKAKRRGARAR